MLRSRLSLRIPALALVAAVIAACGNPAGAPSREPLPSGAVELTAADYEFTPVALTVPAGTVTFAVTNDGSENHEFEVLQGETSVDRIDSFPRGNTEVLTVTLSAGSYTFACRLNGHDILGMKGTLTVTGG